MKTMTIDEARKNLPKMKPGQRVAFVDDNTKVEIGTIRIRTIRCGKEGCTKCPHSRYVYAQYREGKKVKSKYIGVAR